MFTKAFQLAANFTLPVVISCRFDDGECDSTIGACVAVNPEGWILTTAHILDEIQRQQNSVMKHRAYTEEVRELEQDIVSGRMYRKKRVRTLHPPANRQVRNHSVWWGRDGAVLREIALLPAADLALGRLQPFDPGSIAQYPLFKNPAGEYSPGRSLCRLGFPFHRIKPEYDEKKDVFVLPRGAVPLPLFPLEGIFTRVVTAPVPNAPGGEHGKFIETSSPGLQGQSGGPIVDSQGVVWGLQSHTRHYPLGFHPKVEDKHGSREEHQFLNVGMGVHAESILDFLKHRKVAHRVAD